MAEKPSRTKAPKTLSMAFVADDEVTLRRIQEAVAEALRGIGESADVSSDVSSPWSQSGGWVREADGWSQSGGWYLSTNRLHLDESLPPLEKSVTDVLGSLKKIQQQVDQQG